MLLYGVSTCLHGSLPANLTSTGDLVSVLHFAKDGSTSCCQQQLLVLCSLIIDSVLCCL